MMTKLKHLMAVLAVLFATQAYANNHLGVEPLKLDVPEMKAELVSPAGLSLIAPVDESNEASAVVNTEVNAWKPDFSFFKSKTNPGVKPYKFMDDMTFVGVPLFLAGMAIKGDKAMFRVNNKDGKPNTQLLTDFKTGIDDYTQFFGPAMVVGLKLGGVEGRSDWPRLLASSLMGYAIMAGFVNGIKYTAKEMRPDGSTANSWPSGHTATSFVGATILHKEYGLTRSPWYSVAGYGVATATGVMRVLNNRHWISDVMSGAGIGILSAELGYALCDLLFKGKGLLRNDLIMDNENPTFFSIGMGIGLGNKSIDFSITDLQNPQRFDPSLYEVDGTERESLEFRAATVVDAEGAYFFNKYIGVGGRFRVRAMSAKSFGRYNDINSYDSNEAWETLLGGVYDKANQTLDMTAANIGGAPISQIGGVVRSDHLAEFTASAGLYFNLPISSRWSVGTKLLIGRSFTQELDIDGYAQGHVKDIDYDLWVKNGDIYRDPTTGDPYFSLQAPTNTSDNATYNVEWDYLTLGAKSSTSFGTGLSVTYRYKSNFSWRLYCDYDYTKKEFTLTYDPYYFIRSALTPNAYNLVANSVVSPYYAALEPMVYKKDKKMNFFTLGLSFLVNL